MIQDAIEAVVSGDDLTLENASEVMEQIMSGGVTPAQFGAFVTALQIKGESVNEIAGMAKVMHTKSIQVHINGPLVDTCGTGGDGSNSFNISTAAGIVAAGAGIKIAKHGNRAMSGSCGSADILESLGVKIDLGPEGVQKCLDKTGFGFMFAQVFHPSMKFAAGPRKEIGIRTIFNILGPLTNPAAAKSQILGVANKQIGSKIANSLNKLGRNHALVVHGLNGLDEISISDSSMIWELKNKTISEYLITPEDLGLKRAHHKHLKIKSTDESVSKFNEVIDGINGPARDVVLMNAAAALLVGARVSNLKEGVFVAAESIDNGSAKQTIRKLIEVSNSLD